LKVALSPIKRDKLKDKQKLEHFPAKWIPVRRRKCDQTKKLERLEDPPFADNHTVDSA